MTAALPAPPFEGRSSYEALLPRLQDLVAGRAELEARAVGALEQVEAERFPVSPTVRVDGPTWSPAPRIGATTG